MIILNINNAFFQYKSRDTPALDSLNLTIQKGKTTAFVGESGSGKSTIVKLLCRLYDPTDGEILINGQDLKHIKSSSVQKENKLCKPRTFTIQRVY